MELRPKPYQKHVSPTNHKVIMHTKSHIIIQPNHQSIHTFHFISNMATSLPYLNLMQCTWHHTSGFCGKTLYQTRKQPYQRTKQN